MKSFAARFVHDAAAAARHCFINTNLLQSDNEVTTTVWWWWWWWYYEEKEEEEEATRSLVFLFNFFFYIRVMMRRRRRAVCCIIENNLKYAEMCDILELLCRIFVCAVNEFAHDMSDMAKMGSSWIFCLFWCRVGGRIWIFLLEIWIGCAATVFFFLLYEIFALNAHFFY